MNAAYAIMNNKELALNRAKYVAELVTIFTKSRKFNGYSVVRAGSQYAIKFGNTKPYGKMSAESLIDWMERLPLRQPMMQAESMRAELLLAK